MPGRLIARGRAADVFESGPGLVLRRYRTQIDVLREAAVMQLVEGYGYPVSRVHEVCGRDLVMERLDGPTMLADLARRPWRIRRHARTLADLHRRLHEIPAPRWLPAPLGEGDAVLHADLHPDNVLMTSRGPVVIDWTNAVRGPGAADVVYTWLLLATSIPPGGLWQRTLASAGRRLFLHAFLDGFERAELAAHLERVAARRLTDPNLLDAEREEITRLLAAEGVRSDG